MQTLPSVSFKHILISLTSFIGVPCAVGILYNTSLLTESYVFSKSIKLIYCPIILIVFLQYVTNAGYLISSYYVEIHTDDPQ
jgi:hypothetical protein